MSGPGWASDGCHSYPSDVMFVDTHVSRSGRLPTFVGARLQCQSSANMSLFLKVVLILQERKCFGCMINRVLGKKENELLLKKLKRKVTFLKPPERKI